VAHPGIGGRPKAAIADDGDEKAMPSRHLLDFGFDRAGVAIDKDLHADSLADIAHDLTLRRAQGEVITSFSSC
jgi:hypothetical protein